MNQRILTLFVFFLYTYLAAMTLQPLYLCSKDCQRTGIACQGGEEIFCAGQMFCVKNLSRIKDHQPTTLFFNQRACSLEDGTLVSLRPTFETRHTDLISWILSTTAFAVVILTPVE